MCTRRYVLLSAVACSLLFHVNAEYMVQYVCQLDSDIELPGLLSVPSRSIKMGQCRSQFLAKAQTIGDCGRRIRISVCSPSLHDKTSKPQIQQQGAQGDLRGTFRCGACYILPATRPECKLPSWSLSLWSAERIAVTNLRHLAWRHWRGEACRDSAVLVSCRFPFLLVRFFKIRTRIIA